MGGACWNFSGADALMDIRSNCASGDRRYNREYRSEHLVVDFTQSPCVFVDYGFLLVDLNTFLGGNGVAAAH